MEERHGDGMTKLRDYLGKRDSKNWRETELTKIGKII